MECRKIIYKGLPFVGRVVTTRDNVQGDSGLEEYCFLKPSSSDGSVNMSRIPLDSSENPLLFGLNGLARKVVASYGSSYGDIVTFEPPLHAQKTGRVGAICTHKYLPLSVREIITFIRVTDLMTRPLEV